MSSGGVLLLALGIACAQATACAEVTYEEPESYLGDLGGTGPIGAAGSSQGGTTAQGGSSGVGGSPSGGTGTAGTFTGSGGASGRGGSGALGNGGGSVSMGQGGTEDIGPQPDPGTELFSEDFETGTDGWNVAGGTWALSQDGGSNVYGQSDASPSTPILSSAGDVAWRDVHVEADFKVLAFNGSASTYIAGICVRVRSADDFYLVGLRGDSAKHFGIRRFGDSDNNLPQQSDVAGAVGVWQHIEIDVVGSTFTVSVGGMVILQETDATYASGGIGLCTVRASAVFDNIVVRAL